MAPCAAAQCALRPTCDALARAMLKHPMIALALTACATLATAAQPQFTDVPPSLQKVLLGNGLKSAQLGQGVLRLVMDKPQVSELTYASLVYHGICAEQWRHPEEFSRWQLARVELLDAGASQGYAFDARGDTCEQMGRMGKNYRDFIARFTTPCTGGQCPAKP